MNFMNWMEEDGTKVELKYCERCGGLWLRRQAEDGVYCASCRVREECLPRLRERAEDRPRRGRARREDVQCQAQIASLQGIAELEVRP